MPVARAVPALVLALALTACTAGGDAAGHGAGELTVLAAASLTDAYEDLADRFQEEHHAEVSLAFGSSTELAAQAAEGAPGDVLATADEASMRVAERAGVASGPTRFASNALVVVTPPGNPAGITSLDDLAGTTWVRCADEVPCGRVARAVLDDHGVTARPASLEDDVRATLDKVVSGEAEAGLVYASDATAAGDDVTTVEIPGAEEQLTSYYVASLQQSEEADLAQEWVELVTSEEGQQALTDAGFTLP
jgi:molybdate transport system substrate-binding protein